MAAFSARIRARYALISDIHANLPALGPMNRYPARPDAGVSTNVRGRGQRGSPRLGTEGARVWLNRPREAVRILERLGPDRPEALSYWWSLIEAQLMLGDRAAALMSAREASERYRDSPRAAHYELIALAALGRVAEIEALVQKRLALAAEGPPSPAYSFREAAAWLDATDSAAAVRLRNQALAWYEETARDGPPSLGLRVGWAETLVELGDHAAALAVLEDATGAEIEDGREIAAPRDLGEIQVVGLLGRIAALDGDTAEAERLARLLVAVPPRQGLTGVVDPTWHWRPWQQRSPSIGAITSMRVLTGRLART